MRESNPRHERDSLVCCHYTNPPLFSGEEGELGELGELAEEGTGEDTGIIVDERGRVIDFPVRKFIPGVQPIIPLNSTMTVYGKRRSGKSVFLRWFTHHALRQFIPQFWTFTQTRHNLFFYGFMPKKFVIPEFPLGSLNLIMTRQETAINLATRQIMKKMSNPLNPRACVFWDDYSGKDIMYNPTLNRYYYTGRHFQTFNIFNAQYPKLTPPAIRFFFYFRGGRERRMDVFVVVKFHKTGEIELLGVYQSLEEADAVCDVFMDERDIVGGDWEFDIRRSHLVPLGPTPTSSCSSTPTP